MKIAFIGQKGIPAKLGGVEKHVEELATGLAANGHEIFVYVRNNYTDKNLAAYKGVTLIHLPSISTKHLDAISHTFLATVHALFRPYDIIHYQAIGPSSLSWIIKVFKPKAVLVSTFHCQDYFHQKWARFARECLRVAEFITCRIPDQTIAVSQTLGKYVHRAYHKDVMVIPNGFSITPTEKSDELDKWGLQPKQYVLSVSRLIKHKGIHFLIEAFKNLEDKGLTHGLKLAIVGDGSYTDEYVASLKKLADGRASIVFTGAQTGEPLAQLFANAYVFVHPSETEGLSIALLEAMGYGLGILVSNIPENLEAANGSALSFASGNVADLEEKLGKIINDPDKVAESGAKGKARVSEFYNWNNIVLQTSTLYERLVNEK